MRIISDFSDYYDSVQAYGQDQTLVFTRNMGEVVKNSDIPSRMRMPAHVPVLGTWPCITIHVRKHDKQVPVAITFTAGLVWWCGKGYPYVVRRQDGFSTEVNLKDQFFWTAPALLSYMNRHGFKCKPRGRHPIEYHQGKAHLRLNDARHIRLWFDMQPTLPPDAPVIARMENARNAYTMQLNPCLKDIGFGKVKDAFTAFQELDQYLSGVVGKDGPPMVTISDEDLAKQKGFDMRSFRKDPTKRAKSGG